METFDLEFKTQIKLRKLLMKMGICFSKREAKDLILSGMVSVNGIPETRKNVKVSLGDMVKVEGQKIQIG